MARVAHRPLSLRLQHSGDQRRSATCRITSTSDLGSFQQLAIVTGIFISLLTDFALAAAAGGAAAAALGLSAAAQWVANFVVSTTFPTLKNVGLGYAYGLYALAAVLSILFVLAFIRETRGRELETMTESVRGRQVGPQPQQEGR